MTAGARQLVSAWTARLTVVAVACASGLAVGVVGVVRLLAGWLGAAPRHAWLLGIVVGAAALLWDAWRRLGGPLTPTRVALWLEERAPALAFALVSSLEGTEPAAWCAARVRAVDVATPGWLALRRSLVFPLLAAALGTGLAVAAPRLATLPAAVRRLTGGEPAPANALRGVRARITAPAYARLEVVEVDEPNVLHPLIGSAVELTGPLPPPLTAGAVLVKVDSAWHATHEHSRGWGIALTADSETHVVQLLQGTASRLVVIEPRADSLPEVTIEWPARDTVLREPRGVVPLRGRASDDLGLTAAGFEYIVSSGEGERFTFRSGSLGSMRLAGRRTTPLTGTLDVGALQLAAGDVVHVRAVARDGNTANGSGRGASDTRTIRIARAGEYDSVAVDPAAPSEADKSLLSQRMLINLTDALVKRLRTLNQETLVSESRRIARDQARLRKQVSDLVFSRLGDNPSGEHFHGDGHHHGDNEPLSRALTPQELLAAAERATGAGGAALDAGQDETPVVAINTPLLEAYNAMWAAGRELETGRPRTALPPMYVALAAIQRARAAERLYLRGVPPRVVVDVARARLAGRDRGSSAVRAAGVPASPLARDALARLHVALSRTTSGAAADSLLLLRLSLVARAPGAAAALDALIADVRAGRDATRAVALVRRALEGRSEGEGADSLLWWGMRR